MSIELIERDGAAHRLPHAKLPTKEYVFESRKVTFLVRSDDSTFANDWAVMFRVGPLGMNLNPDEAETLGRALIAASEHYRAALARVSGGA